MPKGRTQVPADQGYIWSSTYTDGLLREMRTSQEGEGMSIENRCKELIISILTSWHVGENDAIKRDDLLTEVNRRLAFGRRDDGFAPPQIVDRTLRRYIEDLRQIPRGCMICSTLRGGYFWSIDHAELDEYLGADERRLITLSQRIIKQRKAAGLRTSEELIQMSMELEDVGG